MTAGLQRAYRCELLPSPLMTLSSSSAAEPASSAPLGEATPAPILLKHRFPKRYRHPTLDALLTRQRLVSEARSLVRCLKAGVRVPALRLVDIRQGCLGMEWIDGWTVREILGGGQDDEGLAVEPEDPAAPTTGVRPSDLRLDEGGGSPLESNSSERLTEILPPSSDGMLAAIGREIAKMHLADIIHGDLTTSNLMLRRQNTPGSPPELVSVATSCD
jgi:TP53 regulating kinase-like protein